MGWRGKYFIELSCQIFNQKGLFLSANQIATAAPPTAATDATEIPTIAPVDRPSLGSPGSVGSVVGS